MSDSSACAAPSPHDAIEEIFSDVLWKKIMTPKGGSIQPDFQRLLELDFKHLIAAHGRVCRDHAHEQVKTAVAKAFGA